MGKDLVVIVAIVGCKDMVGVVAFLIGWCVLLEQIGSEVE
jgi:hypothetical protein